jgi:DNA recombination protein RmuC
MKNILSPWHKIQLFEKESRTHKESIDYHAALRQQNTLLRNEYQMSKETINLTKALKRIARCAKANSHWNVC